MAVSIAVLHHLDAVLERVRIICFRQSFVNQYGSPIRNQMTCQQVMVRAMEITTILRRLFDIQRCTIALQKLIDFGRFSLGQKIPVMSRLQLVLKGLRIHLCQWNPASGKTVGRVRR